MKRTLIADIVRESGLSRATVDRVLHNRDGVHPRTRAQVELALARISEVLSPTPNRSPIDVALRLDRGMMDEMHVTVRQYKGRELNIHDLHQMNNDQVLTIIRTLCKDVTRPLVLTVINTPQIVMELTKARRRGKRIVTLISDLTIDSRDAFVGIDNRAAGETAAFIIGRMLGDRPTTVGYVLGDHGYRCHEDRETGFRSALRTHFPKVALAAEAIGQDYSPVTQVAVRNMLKNHPGIAAIYNCSGGSAGLVKAIQEAGRSRDILVIAHEAQEINVPLLRNGQLDFLISQDPLLLLNTAIQKADAIIDDGSQSQELVDFFVHTAFNIPAYAR